MTRKIEKVQPLDRFRIRANRKLRYGQGSIAGDVKSRYFYCAKCGKKTLIRMSNLDVWNPKPSVFPAELQAEFPSRESHTKSFDFFCKGCALPVRIVFWEQERGMGGCWFPLILEIQEAIEIWQDCLSSRSTWPSTLPLFIKGVIVITTWKGLSSGRFAMRYQRIILLPTQKKTNQTILMICLIAIAHFTAPFYVAHKVQLPGQ